MGLINTFKDLSQGQGRAIVTYFLLYCIFSFLFHQDNLDQDIFGTVKIIGIYKDGVK